MELREHLPPLIGGMRFNLGRYGFRLPFSRGSSVNPLTYANDGVWPHDF